MTAADLIATQDAAVTAARLAATTTYLDTAINDAVSGEKSRADTAVANLQTATTQITTITNQLTAANTQLAATKADLNNALADIKTVQAAFDAYKTSHPDAVSTTLYGMNVSPGSSFTNGVKETAADQVERIVNTYGSLDAAKVFYSGALPTVFNNAYEGTIPGKTAFVCFKSDQASVANGKLDAAFTSYCASIPAGWKIYLVNWQEPDDEIWVAKSMSAATHKAADDHLADVVHSTDAYKAGRVEVWSCWMEFSITAGRWQDSVISSKLDGIGWDIYFNTPENSWPDPAARIQMLATVTKRIGIKQWAILETGDRPHANDAQGQGRAAFWTKVYDTATKAGAKAIVYFNALGTTGDHRILPGTPYSDPLISVIKKYTSR